MTTRHAACSCGQLRLTVEGEPLRVSICHCLACQRRTGSAFGVQARFDSTHVRIEGRHSEYVRSSDEGEARNFCFCSDFYSLPDLETCPPHRETGSDSPSDVATVSDWESDAGTQSD